MTLLKKTVLTLAILASGALSVNAASPRIIDKPYYKENSSPLLNIDSIELSDTATILNASFYNSPGYWVSLNKGTYLKGRNSIIVAVNPSISEVKEYLRNACGM